MAENPLKYTNLTYEDILNALNAALENDPRFENLRQSSIATLLMQTIAGAVDLNNYYIERQAEESYFDTMKKKSSAILQASNLGYVVQRPNPASTALQMEIVGPLPSGLVAGDELFLNAKTQFVHNDVPFILKRTYRYEFTSSDISNGVDNTSFSKIISYGLDSSSSNFDLIVSASTVSADYVIDIELIQGEIKEEIVYGSDTDYVGQNFQRYRINDPTFSNLYAENDIGYNSDDDTHDLSVDLTRVAVSVSNVFDEEEAETLVDYSDFFTPDARTLLRVDSPLTATYVSAVPICVIKTLPDGTVEIRFGADNFFARKGLMDVNDNLYVQYFSTLGADANKIGVVGDTLSTDQQFLVNSIDISSNLKFSLRKNILGGADLEDIESIKVNAPSIYYSLDRCVSKRDYISYLKSLTSPINVKNAVAWGEQEEMVTSGAPIRKLMNVGLFSVLGEIYDVESDVHDVKMLYGASDDTILSAAFLDDSYEPYSILPNSFFNILVKENAVGEINLTYNLPSTSKVRQVLSKLEPRCLITVRPVYITPFVNEFDLVGTVYLKKLSNLNYVRNTINNLIYEWLNTNADFDTPIYISNIIEIIQSNPNVVNTNMNFVPYDTSATTFDWDVGGSTINDTDISAWVPVGGESLSAIQSTIISNLQSFISQVIAGDNYSSYSESEIFDYYTSKQITKTWWMELNERSFYNVFAKNLYTALRSLSTIDNCFANSDNFKNVLVKIRNSFDYAIKWGMMDEDGNIVNFSLKNQIAKVRIQLNYTYK